MTFRWLDLMDLARDLAGTDTEAYRRAAVSRAYYAVFHAGRRRWAQDQGLPTDRQIGHGPLWDYYQRRPGETALGVKGRRLLELRKNADYDVAPACTTRDTQRALLLAHELLAHELLAALA